MLTLLNALYSRFTGDSVLTTAFPGGFHRDRAPQGTIMPYVVCRVVSCDAHVSYGGTTRSVVQVRLAVYGVGHDVAGSLAETLLRELDNHLLMLASGVNDMVFRKTDALPTLQPQNSQGDDVWEWTVVYEYGVVSAGG